jgi:hypothetical protein
MVLSQRLDRQRVRLKGWSCERPFFALGVSLKKSQTLFITLFLSTAVASAGPKPRSGNILSQTSVACGTKKSKKQDIHLLCHQYVVRSGDTDYTIRQPKPSEQTIIPLNTAIEFRLDKNKMKFKVDGQSFEFMIISQAAASSATTPASPTPNSLAERRLNEWRQQTFSHSSGD